MENLWKVPFSRTQDAYPFLSFINAEGSNLMILRHFDVTVKQGLPGVYQSSKPFPVAEFPMTLSVYLYGQIL